MGSKHLSAWGRRGAKRKRLLRREPSLFVSDAFDKTNAFHSLGGNTSVWRVLQIDTPKGLKFESKYRFECGAEDFGQFGAKKRRLMRHWPKWSEL